MNVVGNLILGVTSIACLTAVPGAAAGVQAAPRIFAAPQPAMSLQPLVPFEDGAIRFRLNELMETLRDRDHEGWVLSAYPDPGTGRPLIGAGFSLEVAGNDHPQSDPLNANKFLEPSTAQLWQAAGLEPHRLGMVTEEFDREMLRWGVKGYRLRMKAHRVPAELSEEEATKLLRLSTIQAVHNARAYCRNFDGLTGPAQMALSELVFQMGVNLEQFVRFLSELNGDTRRDDLSRVDRGAGSEADHWSDVQNALIESDWARRYTRRAATVIAMFDPGYEAAPGAARQRVLALLRPPSQRRSRRSDSRRGGKKSPGRKAGPLRHTMRLNDESQPRTPGRLS